MSAAELRRAAEEERREWGGDLNARLWPKASRIHLALADWLDVSAVGGCCDECMADPVADPLRERALRVARLINGGAS